jgi:hypothetical protein
MKNTKWIWWTLGILLVVGLVTAAGFSAYRFGYAQGAADAAGGDLTQLFPRYHMRGFDGESGAVRPMDRFHGMDGKRGGMRGGFLPIFGLFGGLFRLALLGGLVWLGYTLFKRSGWQLVKSAPAPAATDDSSGGEKPSV